MEASIDYLQFMREITERIYLWTCPVCKQSMKPSEAKDHECGFVEEE